MKDPNKPQNKGRPLIAIATGIAVYLMALTLAFGLDPDARHMKAGSEGGNSAVSSATPQAGENQEDLTTSPTPANPETNLDPDVTPSASPAGTGPAGAASPDITTAPSPGGASAPSTPRTAPDVVTGPSPGQPGNPAPSTPGTAPDVVTAPSPQTPTPPDAKPQSRDEDKDEDDDD
ncbi:MAG: hypothetical protein A2W01_03865 [Candidatus Solincola sediminis]|uniref:Uncharacterized protein n=1 Tax=Candidatus Solincola sediminis TaxID=1797199 RepID=A0A1F2WPY7_9ACTN|nr:MAG: hypothetical protein A2W01_03865 [Candidatus Solincola sediminis]OFW58938.1 MAG: hypothetical protein A2Y75_00145 [Candidatus Solincola sediminis]